MYGMANGLPQFWGVKMNKILSAAIATALILFGLASCNGCANTPAKLRTQVEQLSSLELQIKPGSMKRSVSRIVVNDAKICSATAVQHQGVLLSASHCLDETSLLKGLEFIKISGPTKVKTFTVNSVEVPYVRRIDDKTDHVLIIVDTILPNVAPVGKYSQREGDNIHYWGNAGGEFYNLFRRGYAAGFHQNDNETIYDINGMKGDSGAGVFNDNEALVAVVSYRWHFEPDFALMSSAPMSFTEAQLKDAGIPLTATNVAFYTGKTLDRGVGNR